MALRAQLTVAEAEQGHDLSRKSVGCLETLRVEHDSSDHVLVGVRHRHGAEKLLQVVWQLGTASVVWVHSDEDAHLKVQFDLTTHELHLLCLLSEP